MSSLLDLFWILAVAGSPGLQDKPVIDTSSPISEQYIDDQGIDTDERVIFYESFDESEIENVFERWESIGNPEIISLHDDSPIAGDSRKSLLVSHIGGESNGGQLYRRLGDGYDKLHYRFYVKFSPDCAPIHHFFHVGGYAPATQWPQGGAGHRPEGIERFSTGVEPFGDQWQWDFYSYWMEMRGSPPRGQCWGNSFLHHDRVPVERGEWICVELMMQMNDVGQSNGEMALWIDGQLAGHLGEGFPVGKWQFGQFLQGQGGETIRWNDEAGEAEPFFVDEGGEPFEGFRWRNDERLNLNFLWLLTYITKADADHLSQVWYDQVVVATEYIGPIRISTNN